MAYSILEERVISFKNWMQGTYNAHVPCIHEGVLFCSINVSCCRSTGNMIRHHRHSQRSRSSSPETLQSTPPRIRSPARMRLDHRPYSPGDLAVEEMAENIDVVQVTASDSGKQNFKNAKQPALCLCSKYIVKVG